MLFGIMIPFVGTALGAATVFLMKNSVNEKVEKLLLGFASGVMIAASVWSLILPSIEMSSGYKLRFVPAAVGFLFGIAFLLILDRAVSGLDIYNSKLGADSARHKKVAMTVLAVTLHNIPEGMAVGVAFAAALNKKSGITIEAATALSIGIAIQNFPEGAIISMPLKSDGTPKVKAFIYGALSGAVEPVFAVMTLLLTGAVLAALPYLLSFAAGAMIYVVAEELIPDSQSGERSNAAIIGLALGFVTMMTLDEWFG